MKYSKLYAIYYCIYCWFSLIILTAGVSGGERHPSSAVDVLYPKREFRAVWIPTVFNIAWPRKASDSPTKQRQDFIHLLEVYKSCGFNAVIVQVRPCADALYAKSREPWSAFLTGTQGKAPTPFWDPLAFMIREAHKRGLEFHAWINPFRSVSSPSNNLAPDHISRLRPEWHLTFSNPYKMLNPGIPQVREYVTSVVMDIVRGYDVDGIHFDDYFYPYDGIGSQDAEAFFKYHRGFRSVEDWRRDNVNQFVKTVSDSITLEKPWIKFGISPFGVWKTGVPSGIVAADTVPLDLYGAYSVIYCDAVQWLRDGSVDYLMPQLYWAFGSKKDYAKLLPWWLSQTLTTGAGRHLYSGNAAYRLGDKSNWVVNEIVGQIRFNRSRGAQGCSLFGSASITNNIKGLKDSLQNTLFRYPALPPPMPWKDAIPPLPPVALTLNRQQNQNILQWKPPPIARDGDTARYYVIYRFSSNDQITTDDPRYICGITTSISFVDTDAINNERYMYIVTALDKLHNESEPTTRISTK